jgi:hypothetical protein
MERESSSVKERSVATLTLHGAGEWTLRGRRDIATWLRRQADELLKEGDNYAGRFTARYYAR